MISELFFKFSKYLVCNLNVKKIVDHLELNLYTDKSAMKLEIIQRDLRHLSGERLFFI